MLCSVNDNRFTRYYLVLKLSLFDLYIFKDNGVIFIFCMMDMKNVCISFSDILTVLHSHNVGVINLSLVIINPQVSL